MKKIILLLLIIVNFSFTKAALPPISELLFEITGNVITKDMNVFLSGDGRRAKDNGKNIKSVCSFDIHTDCVISEYDMSKFSIQINYQGKQYFSNTIFAEYDESHCVCPRGWICDCVVKNKYKVGFNGQKITIDPISLSSYVCGENNLGEKKTFDNLSALKAAKAHFLRKGTCEKKKEQEKTFFGWLKHFLCYDIGGVLYSMSFCHT